MTRAPSDRGWYAVGSPRITFRGRPAQGVLPNTPVEFSCRHAGRAWPMIKRSALWKPADSRKPAIAIDTIQLAPGTSTQVAVSGAGGELRSEIGVWPGKSAASL